MEFHSNAPEKTKAFLKDVFNWKFEEMPAMNYSTFSAPSPPSGGLQAVQNLPAGVLDYILSTDIENTLGKIETSGGAVLMPKTEIPGFGSFAVFSDPTGITLALYQPSRPARRARPARRKAKPVTRKGRKSRGRR